MKHVFIQVFIVGNLELFYVADTLGRINRIKNNIYDIKMKL